MIENGQSKSILFDLKNYITETPNIDSSFTVLKSLINFEKTKPLIDLYEQVMGVKVYQKGKGKPVQTNYEIENDVFISKNEDETFNFPFISQGIKRYFYETQNEFINYGKWLAEPREISYFTNPKIVIREIINPTIFATYIEEDAVVKNIASVIIQKNEDFPIKFLLALINSKLINYYVNEQSPKSGNKTYPSFNSKLLKNIPIKECSKDVKFILSEKANQMLSLNKELQEQSQKFQRNLTREHAPLLNAGLPKRLQDWYLLFYSDFIKELEKQKVKLTLTQKAEWEDYFTTEAKKVLEIKNEINTTDKAIDAMVYELYGLSEEEIAIVESLK